MGTQICKHRLKQLLPPFHIFKILKTTEEAMFNSLLSYLALLAAYLSNVSGKLVFFSFKTEVPFFIKT